jgi:hypothetical protein
VLDSINPVSKPEEKTHIFAKIAQQLAYANGRVPIYPGIGAQALESDAVLAQIEGTRAAHTGGFIIFEFAKS